MKNKRSRARSAEALSKTWCHWRSKLRPFDWAEPPVSTNGLVKYCREAKITGEKVEH